MKRRSDRPDFKGKSCIVTPVLYSNLLFLLVYLQFSILLGRLRLLITPLSRAGLVPI